MVTGLRGPGLAARALLALFGLTGVIALALPAADAATAPQSGRLPIPAAAGDLIGDKVAISGSTAVVGAPGAGGGLGAVYVLVRSGTTWHLQATLRDPRQRANEDFGAAVAVSSTASGTFVLVGAPGQGLPESAYVFARSGKRWYRQATLAGPAGSIFDGSDDFGLAVALSSTTAVVSTNQAETDLDGPVYVFVRSGKTWHRQAILDSPQPSEMNFGGSVGISGGYIVVTASNRGCAVVFARSGRKWALQATLVDTGTAAACPAEADGSGFGYSAAISGSTVVIGTSPQSDTSGEAVVFTRSGTTWSRQTELTDPRAADGVGFGASVALSGDTAVVGAPFPTSHCGSAYAFTRSGTTWSHGTGLARHGCSASEHFGASVAESAGTALAGAPGKGAGGAAYWQTLP
jgi:hypothetical protein